MTVLWRTLAAGSDPPEVVNALIEIPRGSNVKYEIDHETGAVFVDRVLHTAFAYPFDYGLIPRTWYFDDDPIDIMVLTRVQLFPGCVVPARPIGFVRMRDEAGLDNKILAVPAKDPHYDAVAEVSDLAPSILSEIKHFLEHYKDLEPGKWVKVEGWDGAATAKEEIVKAIGMYEESHPSY
jgi:inorganic pyrophosphatase